MRLSNPATEILITCGTISGWHLRADNIVFVAELLKAGLVGATDDYEGPRIYITDSGRKYLLRKKLICLDPEYPEFCRTPAGEDFRKFEVR